LLKASAMAPTIEEGSKIVDFTFSLETANGAQRRTLAEFQAGKPTVIDFFAPWCGSCPAAAQKLDELAKGKLGEQCKFLLMCVDGDVEVATAFAKQHGITHCHIAAVEESDMPR